MVIEQITVEILEICQNKDIQILWKDRQINIRKEKDPNQKLLKKIQEVLIERLLLLYQSDNVYNKVRYYWQKIKANRKTNRLKQKDSLLSYYVIGSSFERHQERI